MIHNKTEIEAQVKQLLLDIKREYLLIPPIEAEFIQNLEVLGTEKILSQGWEVHVPVYNDQFNNDAGSIFVYIDDQTSEVVVYLDTSLGRPIPRRAVKDSSGKYFLEILPQ